MRLVSFLRDGVAVAGVRVGDEVADLSRAERPLPTDMAAVLSLGMDAVAAALGSAPRVPAAGLLFAPVVPRPGKVICIGLNYALHAKEGGNPIPDYPAVFLRCTTSLCGHGEPMLVPAASANLDWEAELAVVIGRRAHRVSEETALGFVAGYSCFNEGSVRDYQRRSSQWTVGKNFDATGGFGPDLVSADELPPGAAGLRIMTRVNGAVMQDSTTGDMIFPVARIVALMSEVMTLEPGDVIATGTPSGVGYARKPPVFLRPGDVCEVEIELVGTLRNPVAAG